MDRFKILWIVWPVLIIFLAAGNLTANEVNKRIFRIGTGGETGVYYPIGKLIAAGLTDSSGRRKNSEGAVSGVPGCLAVAHISAGSVENVKGITSNEIEAGLVQADVASMAAAESGVFSGQPNSQKLRAIASLYPEKFHIVVRKDAGVLGMLDLTGKRISLDEPGSGTLSVMRILLDAHGLSEKQIDAVYLKPVFIKEKMISGDLQGFVMMAGTPLKSVSDLLEVGLRLVPVQRKKAETVSGRYPYLVPGVIRDGVYPGIPQTPTVQVYALFAVSSDLDADLVYQVTQTLWSRHMRTILEQGHPRGQNIRLETAMNGLSIPLHEGAMKFYREQGMVTP